MKAETKEYMVLMIMTDGIIHDKEEVKEILREALLIYGIWAADAV